MNVNTLFNDSKAVVFQVLFVFSVVDYGHDHAIGIFEDNSQVIYLKDKKKNKLHNLSSGPYSFVSKAGTFENRFEVVYKTH
jgi:hypothetical protein